MVKEVRKRKGERKKKGGMGNDPIGKKKGEKAWMVEVFFTGGYWVKSAVVSAITLVPR